VLISNIKCTKLFKYESEYNGLKKRSNLTSNKQCTKRNIIKIIKWFVFIINS
jgi:hypothetical protein